MKTVLASSLLLSLLAPLASHANLVVNGSFEQGNYTGNASWTGVPAGGTDVTGWTATQGFDWHQDQSQVPGAEFGPAYDGVRMVDLTLWSTPGGLEQVISTVPGIRYHVSWAAAAPAANSTYDVTIDGLATGFAVSASPRNAMVWTVEGLDFTATGAATTLGFRGTTANFWGAVIDGVSVTAPSCVCPDNGTSLALLGLAALSLASIRRQSR